MAIEAGNRHLAPRSRTESPRGRRKFPKVLVNHLNRPFDSLTCQVDSPDPGLLIQQ